jgi:hypothetical protein
MLDSSTSHGIFDPFQYIRRVWPKLYRFDDSACVLTKQKTHQPVQDAKNPLESSLLTNCKAINDLKCEFPFSEAFE